MNTKTKRLASRRSRHLKKEFLNRIKQLSGILEIEMDKDYSTNTSEKNGTSKEEIVYVIVIYFGGKQENRRIETSFKTSR